jgi:hypothetical protein
MNKYRQYLTFAKWTFLTMFTLGFVSALTVTYAIWPLEIKFTPAGFTFFFANFNAPITFFGVGFAVFASWLTLGRMDQTETQISLVADNNRFNNYYKHIDEFKNHIRQYPKLSTWLKHADQDIEPWLLELYREFYYKHPNEFAPRMNSKARVRVDLFLSTIIKSSLNAPSTNLLVADKQILDTLRISIPRVIGFGSDRINSIESKTSRNFMRAQQTHESVISATLRTFVYLNQIYWTCLIYLAFLEFDGEEPPNLVNYLLGYIGLKIDHGI